MVRTHVWGSALAIAVASASPVHAVILPAAGMYQVNEFTTAVSGGVNGECDPWGPANSPATPAFFHYLGPSQPSAWQRAPNIGPDSSFVYTLYFPKTPAKRVTSWSGIYQATFPPLRLLTMHRGRGSLPKTGRSPTQRHTPTRERCPGCRVPMETTSARSRSTEWPLDWELLGKPSVDSVTVVP